MDCILARCLCAWIRACLPARPCVPVQDEDSDEDWEEQYDEIASVSSERTGKIMFLDWPNKVRARMHGSLHHATAQPAVQPGLRVHTHICVCSSYGISSSPAASVASPLFRASCCQATATSRVWAATAARWWLSTASPSALRWHASLTS